LSWDTGKDSLSWVILGVVLYNTRTKCDIGTGFELGFGFGFTYIFDETYIFLQVLVEK
jgi:hypothetical protein